MKLSDRITTFWLFAVTVTIEAVGYACLALFGYGWFWGPHLPYGLILRHPISHLRMEGFYAGLVVTPVAVSLAVSLAYDQPLVTVTVAGSLAALLSIHRYFKKNFFIPLCYGICMALVVFFACLLRLSVMLLFFSLYALLIFIGPLLLALFLASI